MPICANPNRTIPFVLRGDQAEYDKTIAEAGAATPPPAFGVRFLSADAIGEVRGLIASAEQESAKITDETPVDDRKTLNRVVRELLSRAIAVARPVWPALVDEFGQPIDPTTRAASDILTDIELWELAYACIQLPRLNEQERRNFKLPSAGNGTSSASAEPTAASA